jgi:hypothetical protein
MVTRIIVSTVVSSFVASFAFGQMKYSRSRLSSPTPTPSPTSEQKTVPVQTQSPMPRQRMMPRSGQPKATPMPTPPSTQSKAMPTPPTIATVASQSRPTAAPAPTVAKPTPTPVPPPDVRAYLDRQVANSKDKKFHLSANGNDLALMPFHVWAQKSTGPDTTSTCIDMKSDDGRIYDIDFATTGKQVTSIRVHKINGEPVR